MMGSLDRLRAENDRAISETKQRNEEQTEAMNRAAGLGPPKDGGKHWSGSFLADSAQSGTSLPTWGSTESRSSEGYLTKGVDLTSPDISGAPHEGEAARLGGYDNPTLSHQFNPRAGREPGNSTELPDKRLEDARLHAAGSDPVSLPSQPLAPQAMAPSDLSQLTSFMTKFLRG